MTRRVTAGLRCTEVHTNLNLHPPLPSLPRDAARSADSASGRSGRSRHGPAALEIQTVEERFRVTTAAHRMRTAGSSDACHSASLIGGLSPSDKTKFLR
jgi:hypothetical protein